MQLARRPLAPGEMDYELLWLCVSLGGLALAASWLALHLPWPICLFHAITGHPCATCGATRSAIAFFHGNFVAAIRWNPLAFAGYCALSIFDVYAFCVLVLRAPRVRFINWTATDRRIARYCFITLFLLNWAYLLAMTNA